MRRTNNHAAGSRFPVEVHSAAFVDRGVRHIVAVARDLSQRHAAERQYRQLMDSIDKGILVQAADGTILPEPVRPTRPVTEAVAVLTRDSSLRLG